MFNAGIELLTLLQILQELKLSDGGEALNGMGSHSIYWSSHSFSRCCHWLWDGKTKTSPSTPVSVTNSSYLMDILFIRVLTRCVYYLVLQMEEIFPNLIIMSKSCQHWILYINEGDTAAGLILCFCCFIVNRVVRPLKNKVVKLPSPSPRRHYVWRISVELVEQVSTRLFLQLTSIFDGLHFLNACVCSFILYVSKKKQPCKER